MAWTIEANSKAKAISPKANAMDPKANAAKFGLNAPQGQDLVLRGKRQG